jgi:hypothetical protein
MLLEYSQAREKASALFPANNALSAMTLAACPVALCHVA